MVYIAHCVCRMVPGLVLVIVNLTSLKSGPPIYVPPLDMGINLVECTNGVTMILGSATYLVKLAFF